MQCPTCQMQIDDDTVFCGNCGTQIAPSQAPGVTMAYPTDERGASTSVMRKKISPPRATPAVPGPFARQAPPDLARPPRTSLTPPPRSFISSRRRPGLLIIAVVLLVLLAGGSVLAYTLLKGKGAVVGSGSAQVSFFDSSNGTGNTDALSLTTSGLAAPPAGLHYDAWLVDEAAEHSTLLGQLSGQNGTFTLNFAGTGSNGQVGTNLLGLGNVVEISQEQGNVQQPSNVVLVATFPPKAYVHVKHLLFSFPITPNKIGLLAGLLGQTKLLSAQALALQSIAGNQNNAAITCIVQSIIDISEGQQGPHAQPLPASCGASVPTGDGFGILGSNGYGQTSATHASLAATQSDTTAVIRTHANEVEIGATNIIGWVTTIDNDALKVLANPNDRTSINEIVVLADHAFKGVANPSTGQVGPVTGEEGAETAYLRGQLTAGLTLVPSPQASAQTGLS